MLGKREAPPRQELIDNSPSVELSEHRTSLSFERTAMSADSALMSTIRTSLSLIGFGFTIYQVLGKASAILPRASVTGRNLGFFMLMLGLLLLAMGIVSHAIFGRELTRRRQRLYDEKLMHRVVRYRMTPTYIGAVLLLAIGLLTLASITFRLAS